MPIVNTISFAQTVWSRDQYSMSWGRWATPTSQKSTSILRSDQLSILVKCRSCTQGFTLTSKYWNGYMNEWQYWEGLWPGRPTSGKGLSTPGKEEPTPGEEGPTPGREGCPSGKGGPMPGREGYTPEKEWSTLGKVGREFTWEGTVYNWEGMTFPWNGRAYA